MKIKVKSIVNDLDTDHGLYAYYYYPVVITTSQKTNSNTSNKSQGKYQVEITRELNKESPMYCYLIYTKLSWSMLTINSPTLMSMYSPYFYHVLISCLL